MRGPGATVAALAAALVLSSGASAGSDLVVGFDDNALLWDTAAIVAPAQDLGARGFRLSVNWSPGQTTLTSGDAASLDRAIAAAAGLRIVLVVVGGAATDAPQDDPSRTTFCTYARNILARYPSLRDVVVWNEPNKTAAWRPQFNADGSSASPAAYEALLATCYDVLHAFRPAVRVLGLALSPDGNDNPNAVSNVSHSPGNFIRRVGTAYQASGRSSPILDVVAHHVYGATSAERPWRQHTGQTRIAQGDWDKLMTNLHTAFDSTNQPVPGRCVAYRCVSIFYMEDGFQTSIDSDKAGLYSNAENVPTVPDDAGGEPATPPPSSTSPAPDQATQVLDSVRLAACQNYVGGFFNFMLRDEADLRGWQSGPLWADGSRKDSYASFKQAFAEANAEAVDCTALKGGLPPRPDTTAPGAPTGLAGSSDGKVSLDWADGPETDVRGFDVLRGTTSGGPYTRLNADPVPASSYEDRDVVFGRTYYYVVLAVDTADNRSAASAEFAATPHGPTSLTLQSFTAGRSRDGVLLRWRMASQAATVGFHLYRADGGVRTRLDMRLVAAHRSRAYAFRDRLPFRRSVRYWLEEVRRDGSTVTYGPRRAAS